MSFSPQPQVLSVHPTPRSVMLPSEAPHQQQQLTGSSSPPPALHLNHSANSTASPGGGSGVTRHHVWTIGTSKRNTTKSALRRSALARHQQTFQQEDVGGGGGGASTSFGDATSPTTFDQQVHYGIAGYRAESGGVSFYRTSVHRKDPQNIVLSHGVMTRVVDLKSMTATSSSSPPPPPAAHSARVSSGAYHARTISGGGSIGGGDDGTGTPPPLLSRYDHHGHYGSPWSPRDDGTLSLEDGGAGGGSGIGGRNFDLSRTAGGVEPRRSRSPPGGGGGAAKPRWNTSAKVVATHRGTSPPPPGEASGTARASSTQRGDRGGVSPQAIRSALAGGGSGGGGGGGRGGGGASSSAMDGRATSANRVNVVSPPRVHGLHPLASSPPGGPSWATYSKSAAAGALSSRASNASIPPFLSHQQGGAHAVPPSLHSHHSSNIVAGGHDCRDARCMHSRGDIVEVIAAKSQVRAMESQLLHEEIRREQLATALSSERERNQQLSQSLARAETSLHASQQQVSDGEYWRSEYERRHSEATSMEVKVHALEADVIRFQSTIDQQRDIILKLEATVRDQSHEVDEWSTRYRTLSNQIADLQQQQQHQQQQQQQLQLQHQQQQHVHGSYARPASPQTSSMRQQHQQYATGGSADAEAVKQRVVMLEAELDKAREERAADERLRKELLRALSDKEKQLVSSGSFVGMGGGGSGAPSGKSTPLTQSMLGSHNNISSRLHMNESGGGTAVKMASPQPVPFSPSTAPQPQNKPATANATAGAQEHVFAASAGRYSTVVTTTSVVQRSVQQGDANHIATQLRPQETPSDSMMMLDVTAASTVDTDDGGSDAGGDDSGLPTPPLLARTSVSHRLF